MRQRLKASTIPPKLNCSLCHGSKIKPDIGGMRIACDCKDYYALLDEKDIEHDEPAKKPKVDKRARAYKEAKAKLISECNMTADEADSELLKASH